MPRRIFRVSRWLLVTTLVLAAPGAAQEPTPEVRKLLSFIAQSTVSIDSMDELAKLAVDAGPSAVPALREMLGRDQGHSRELAAMGLAFLGGDDAVTALRKRYESTHELRLRSLVAMAMASTPLSPENRAFLEASLKGPHFGTEWMPIMSAALSLGVLHATESRAALERTAKSEEESFASEAAAEALRWIEHGPWKVEIPPDDRIEPPIEAVLRNGVPGTDRAERFFDEVRQLEWIRREDTWTVEKSGDGGERPSIGFDVHTSPDGLRALVEVSLRFGPKEGVGYDYVLCKTDGSWEVQAVFFTWVS
jgi:hypothetical protein